MATNESRLIRAARKLDERAPVEPIVIKVYYTDWRKDTDGDETLAYELTLDGDTKEVIQLRWPEDE